MPLYKIAEKKIEPIKETPFKLEEDIQEIVESNLDSLFGFRFVKSEFQIGGLRIDTLAFDTDAKSFVIIEYKKDRNFSVVDQGLSYLGLMLNNKADFILEFNEHCDASLKRNDVDWSQSKVMFISPSFTEYQLGAINFKDLPIELWEVRRYANNTVRFDQHKSSQSNATLKTVSKKGATVEKITREVKAYTEEKHLKVADTKTIDLYNRFKALVLAIGSDITIRPMKVYIAFRTTTNITDVEIKKKRLTISINLGIGELDDPKNLTRDVSKIGHWGNGDYQIQLSSEDELEYVVSLVRQSYKLNS